MKAKSMGGWRPVVGTLAVGCVVLAVCLRLEGAPVPNQARSGEGLSAKSAVPLIDSRENSRVVEDVQVQRPSQVLFGNIATVPGQYPVSAPVVVDYRDDEGTRGRQMGLFSGPMPKLIDGAQGGVANIPAARKCVGGTNNGLDCTSDANCPGLADGLCKQGANPCPPGATNCLCTGGAFPGSNCGSDEDCAGSHCGCSFPIQCDDGLPCTHDRCSLKSGRPAGTGRCIITTINSGDEPLATGCKLGLLCGGCDDGIACNGVETCNAGACQSSGPVNCGGGSVCNENGRCAGGAAAGRYCTIDNDCPSSTCNHCQATCAGNGPCDDGLACNGSETCDIPSGRCLLATSVPCGPGGLCGEKRCSTVSGNPWSCGQDSDCAGGGTCTTIGASCQMGRCCDTASPQPNCTRRGFGALPGVSACTGQWFAGDNGTTSIARSTTTACPTANTPDLPTGVPGLRCPKYGDGIAPQAAGPIAGPISDSTRLVSPFGTALNKLGDDYQLTDSGNILVDELHWIGGRLVDNRLSVEFYDFAGNFIEDTFINYADDGVTVKGAHFQPAIELPAHGWVVFTVASSFSPNARYFWATTSSATTDVGTNDSSQLWINDCLNPGTGACGRPNPLAGSPNMAFEIVGRKTAASVGACCLTAPGPVQACDNATSPWVCEGQGGIYLGNNQNCASCDSGTHLGEYCRRCSPSSGNPGAACVRNSECTGGGTCIATNSVCTADGNPSAVCVSAASCNNGACCNAGVCTLTTPGGCSGTFQGFGTSCDHDNGYDPGQQNCCPQPTFSGADNCGQAIVHNIPVPAPGSDPVTITITGNNAGATSTLQNPDTCQLASPSNDPEAEVGWWEAFSINSCAYVRIDTCCTGATPNIFRPAWAFVYPDCPCGGLIGSAANPHSPLFNGAPEPNFNRGGPYCQNDNIWQWFGPLEAHTYWYPIYSALLGYHGQYQLHITVQACPEAACCVEGVCQVLNEVDCAAAGGWYLGPPNRFPSQGTCINSAFCVGGSNPGAPCTSDANCLGGGRCPLTCNSGSCCTGPGVCKDRDLDPPISEVECETPGDVAPNGGTFVGGTKCKGGSCSANSDFSCATDADCSVANGGPGGTCLGDARTRSQATPCPICEIAGPTNCQLWENTGGLGGISDRSIGSSGILTADDFKSNATTVSQACAWGQYINGAPGAALECGPSVTADNFRVRIYEDFEGLPCDLVGESLATSARADQENARSRQLQTPIKTYGFQLTLVNPITGLDGSGNTTYWLEISNSPTSPNPLCTWFWDQNGATSGTGNKYSASGSDAGGYPAGSERVNNYAWCLSGNIGSPGPDEPTRACCNCTAGTCGVVSLDDCSNATGIWDVDASVCSPCSLGGPPNDNCTSTIGNLVGPGTYSFDVQCANNDGPSTGMPSETGGSVRLEPDAWYRFQAPVNCTLTASMCPSGTAFDSMVGIYHDPGNPTYCPTNANNGNSKLLNGRFEDESCTGVAVGGAGVAVHAALAGEVYVIRVGGYNGGKGSAAVDISCVPTSADIVLDPMPFVDASNRGTRNCGAGAAPLALQPDPTAIDKVRYLSFVIPPPATAAGETAIQVKLVSLMHPSPPNLPQFPAPNFTAQENTLRYVGTPTNCTETESPPTTFKCAQLQCAPVYIDWAAAVGTSTLHVTGRDAVPSSSYELRQLAASCQGSEAGCTAASAPLTIGMQRWGDLVSPFQATGNVPLTQPAIGDIVACVDKFRGLPSAVITARGDVNPGIPNNVVQIPDVANVVDAFKAFAYPFTGAAGPQTCP